MTKPRARFSMVTLWTTLVWLSLFCIMPGNLQAGESLIYINGDSIDLNRVKPVPDESNQEAWSAAGDLFVSPQDVTSLNVSISSIDISQFPIIFAYTRVLDQDGHAVIGLTASNFSLTEDSVAAFLQSTPIGSASGISVALVMDVSGSMSGTPIDDAKTAAKNFINTLGANDRVAVIAFSSNNAVNIVQSFTSDKSLLTSAVDSLSAGGSTALNDGIMMGLDQTVLEAGVKAVIAFTDGQENNSARCTSPTDASCVVNYADSMSIPVCTIGLGSSADGNYLSDIADGTGGYYLYAPDAAQLQQLYSDIVGSIAMQYRIVYTSPRPVFDGTTRTVNVTVNYSGTSATGSGTYTVGANPPTIGRTPATVALSTAQQPENLSVTISAVVTGPNPITNVRLFYRTTNSGSGYKQKTMTLGGGSTYSAAIPAADVLRFGIDYYITASDASITVSDPAYLATTHPYQFPVYPNYPPVILHTPVTLASVGSDIAITATVTDTTDNISTVDLYYRKVGDYLYSGVSMSTTSATHYAQMIPGSSVTPAGVEYYIVATDNYGVTSSHGSFSSPHFIAVTQGACPGATINSGETRSGNISGPSYQNTWTFCGTAGDRVLINAVKTSGGLETKIIVYPPGGGGAEIISAYAGFGAWVDQVEWQLQHTGLYTIVIEDGGLTNSGTYNISLLTMPGAVNSSGDPDGGLITSGETLSGTINVASEIDAFQFYGDTADRVLINAVKTSGGLETKIIVYPPGGGGAEVMSAYAGFGAWVDQVEWQLQHTGLYTIVIEDGGLTNSGTYNISLLKMPGAVNSSGDPDGGLITSGEILSGTINVASDIDAFQFYGDTADRVLINAVTTSGGLETKIIVYPPGGGAAEVISAYAGFGTWVDQVDWQLQHTGLYTIVIEDGWLTNSGTYNISLLKIPGAVNSSGDPDGGLITSGETLSGTINVASDIDAFQFYGDTADRVIINVTTPGGLETKIFVYPPGGGVAEVISAYAGFGTWVDQVEWQLQHTGLYTIVIEDGWLTNSGTYNISLLKIPGAVNSSADPDGGLITSGETLSGTINVASDIDAFQFYGDTADRVLINAVTTSGGLDAKIFVYPPGGGVAEVMSAYAGFGAWADQVDWQLQHTGLYTIVIEDGWLTNSGTYTISLTKDPSTLRPGIYNPFPANGATLFNVTGSFSWNAVTGATGYDLYFGEDVTQPLVKIGDNLASPSMPFPAIQCGMINYWHVIAHTPSGDIQGPLWWFDVPCAEPGWFEDFESYDLNTFPYLAEWFLIYDGANQSNQYVDNVHSVSGSHSLHLAGSSGVSAGAFRLLGSVSKVKLDAEIFIDQIVNCSSFPTSASMNLRDRASGATFGGIRFSCDGNIYAIKDNIANITTLLIPYVAQKWYHVSLNIDLSTMSFDVSIDGVLKGQGIQLLNTGTPTGIGLFAGSTVWFDDVQVATALGAPVLISPTGTITTTTPTYTWNKVAGATSYQITLYDYTTTQYSYSWYTAAEAHCDAGQTQCTITQAAPLSAGVYRWWVKAKNTAGTGPNSAGLTCTVTTTAPSAPVQTIPSGTINNQTPTYTWNAVGGTAQYQITFYNYTTAQYTYTWYTAAQAHCDAGQAQCTIAQVNPFAEGNYKWWVKGQNVWGTGPNSVGKPFTVFLGTIPAAPVQVTPIGLTGTQTPTYTWNAIAGTTKYQISMYDYTTHLWTYQWYTAAEAHCEAGQTQCTIAQATPLAEGNYLWYVRAMNPVGTGPWSSSKMFTVFLGTIPPALNQISPEGAITTANPTYTWDAIAKTAKYQVSIYNYTTHLYANTWYTAAAAHCDAGQTQCTIDQITPLSNGTYKWGVQGMNPAGTGPWSSGKIFTKQ